MNGETDHLRHDYAEAYDIAFDWRDLTTECEHLDEIWTRHHGRTGAVVRPESFVDICCGPGFHCIEYGRRGLRAYGVDRNPRMLEYAREKARRLGASVDFVEADMRDFTLPRPVDLAFCGMASFHYLLTNDDIVRHLQTVACNLVPGGLYVIEANHPRDAFRVGRSALTDWEARRGDKIVRVHWGTDDEGYDPITQIARGRVRFEMVWNGGQASTVEFSDLDRYLTFPELSLLIEKSGVFEAVAWLGALSVNQPFDNSKPSWRMIPVLRRQPGSP